MGASRYTYAVKRLGGDVYEVVFRWRKLGMTRFYRVRFKVIEDSGGIVYASTPDSEHPFRLELLVRRDGNGSRVEAEARMDAGLMASLLGRRDFREFVEELVDSGIAHSLRRLAASLGESKGNGAASCRSCILYSPSTRYCYLLGRSVDDPEKPPCGGSYLVKAPKQGENLVESYG